MSAGQQRRVGQPCQGGPGAGHLP